jgi:putative transposase
MSTIRIALTAGQRREVETTMRETNSRVEAARCRIILLLDGGEPIGELHKIVGCVRSTVYTTVYRFEDEGVAGLRDKRLEPQAPKATPAVREQLLAYVDKTPQDYGWQRSTWTLELFAKQLKQDTGVAISPSHIRVVLRQEKCRRGRPRPALRIPVRGRRAILDEIDALVQWANPDEEVFYVDEADVDLNPRIGLTYIKQGAQPLVLTPGTNVKYYIAGALNSRTGRVLYSHGPRKASGLFIDLLGVLQGAYRRARRIHLVLDNYIIHKSRVTRAALERFDGRIQLHFLPPYSPEHNPIERLWKQLHDNVTRNHRHPDMPSLWKNVTRFMHDVQPFPGTNVSTQRKAA